MVHISSARLLSAGPRPTTALGWGLGLSVCLHLLVVWPTPARAPQQTPVASPIRAELRPRAQVAVPRHDPATTRSSQTPPSIPDSRLLDSDAASAVPRRDGGKGRSGTVASGTALAASPRLAAKAASASASRQVEPTSSSSVPVQGDALTRYRLGLAWGLGRDDVLRAVGSPARPVTVELVVVLAEGRAIAVEVADDGGFTSLAARAAERARQAVSLVPVPPELGEASLRVNFALRFEP